MAVEALLEVNTVGAEVGSGPDGFLEEIQRSRPGPQAALPSTTPEETPMRAAESNPKRQNHLAQFLFQANPKHFLSGLRSTGLGGHRAGRSTSRFVRCPYQSSLGMVASASTPADGGSRWTDSAKDLEMGTAVEGV